MIKKHIQVVAYCYKKNNKKYNMSQQKIQSVAKHVFQFLQKWDLWCDTHKLINLLTNIQINGTKKQINGTIKQFSVIQNVDKEKA